MTFLVGIHARRYVEYESFQNHVWLLKNSFGVLVPKTRCARMPYKRFSPLGIHFWSPNFGSFCH